MGSVRGAVGADGAWGARGAGGGDGAGGGGARRPNTTAYFVALAGILVLLAALCCYFFYFCLSKVKELTREDSPLNQPCTNTAGARARAASQRAGPGYCGYPVHSEVRDSATAMAKLCRSLPAARAPAPASPDGSADPATDSTTANDASASASATPEKLPPKPAVCTAGGILDS